MSSDDNLHIEDGENFTRNQLKSRLNKMDFDFDPNIQKKKYFVDLYNIAIRNPIYRKKIENLLQKDTNDYLEKKKKRIRDLSQEAERDLKVEGKASKNENSDMDKDSDHQVISSNKSKEQKNLKKSKEKLMKILEEDFSTQNMNAEKRLPKNLDLSTPINPSVQKEDISYQKLIENKPEKEVITTKNANIKTTKICINKLIDTTNILNQNSKQNQVSKVESNLAPNINTTIKNPLSDNYQFPDKVKKFEHITFEAILNKFNKESNSNHHNLGSEQIQNTLKHNKYTESKQVISSFNLVDTNKNPKISSAKNSSLVPLHQTDFPIIEPNIINITESKENVQNIQNLSNNIRYFDKEENGQAVPYGTVSFTISKIELLNNGKRDNDYQKWYGYYELPSIRHLIKYFVAGVACSVVFSGLLYCIKYSRQFSFENIQFSPFSGNTGMDPTKNVEIKKVNEQSFISDDTYKYFQNIYLAISNPREFLWQKLIDLGKYLILEMLWLKFREYFWQFLGIIILKFIAYKAYNACKIKRDTHNIFTKVKERLRTINDSNNYLEGIPEDEIIRDYSKDYGYKEEYFKNNILPQLRNMRKGDEEIREFETYINGRNRIVWQYADF